MVWGFFPGHDVLIVILVADESNLCRKPREKRVVRVPAISDKNADIPADNYSWRKYGQKPIKGSPHPRYWAFLFHTIVLLVLDKFLFVPIKLHAILLVLHFYSGHCQTDCACASYLVSSKLTLA
jgi:hypothetical protein